MSLWSSIEGDGIYNYSGESQLLMNEINSSIVLYGLYHNKPLENAQEQRSVSNFVNLFDACLNGLPVACKVVFI